MSCPPPILAPNGRPPPTPSLHHACQFFREANWDLTLHPPHSDRVFHPWWLGNLLKSKCRVNISASSLMLQIVFLLCIGIKHGSKGLQNSSSLNSLLPFWMGNGRHEFTVYPVEFYQDYCKLVTVWLGESSSISATLSNVMQNSDPSTDSVFGLKAAVCRTPSVSIKCK